MEDQGYAPDEIRAAILRGEEADVATVRQWLDTGGDANAKCPGFITEFPWESVLQRAARRGNTEILSLLLSRGADIDFTDPGGMTALFYLMNYWRSHRSLSALRVLLSHGADVNLARKDRIGSILDGMSPLMCAASAGGPDLVRPLLRAGADPEQRDGGNCTVEERARSESFRERPASAVFLRDVRLAGGWVRYFLRPHYDLLVLRALCHRRRATFDSWTPEVLVRLFGAPEARRRNNAVRGRADLPDPLFWRVLEFSLGTPYDYPWVRQRVRAARAAVAAAE